MRKFQLFGLVAAAMLLSSCTQRILDFTLISSRNVPITEKGADFQKAPSRVTGEDAKIQVLGFGAIPNMKEAIDRALDKYPGAVALADGVVYAKSWSALLVGQNKYIVEGTPVYSQSASAGSYTPAQQSVQGPSDSQAVLVFHTVKSGDTVQSIASDYGCSVADIIKWNQLSSTQLATGTKLKLYIR